MHNKNEYKKKSQCQSAKAMIFQSTVNGHYYLSMHCTKEVVLTNGQTSDQYSDI